MSDIKSNLEIIKEKIDIALKKWSWDQILLLL